MGSFKLTALGGSWAHAFCNRFRDELVFHGAVLPEGPEEDIRVLGSGALGFVLPTDKSGLVIKVTTDPSEGILAHHVSQYQHSGASKALGIVWLDKVMRGPSTFEHDFMRRDAWLAAVRQRFNLPFSNVYVIVREEVKPSSLSPDEVRYLDEWQESGSSPLDGLDPPSWCPTSLRLMMRTIYDIWQRLGAWPVDLHGGNAGYPSHRKGFLADSAICFDLGSAAAECGSLLDSARPFTKNPCRVARWKDALKVAKMKQPRQTFGR